MNKILNLLSESQVSLLKSHFDYVCNMLPRSMSDSNMIGHNSHEMYADPITENILNYVHPTIQEAYGKAVSYTHLTLPTSDLV